MDCVERVRDLTCRLRVAWPEGKPSIRAALQSAVAELFAELDALEDDLTRKRDWLDTHRDDPRWGQRKQVFETRIVARHAAMAEILDNACRELDGRSYLTWPH